MPRKKEKHPIEMTTDELAAHVFHPRVLKAAREEIRREMEKRAKRPKKSPKRTMTKD